MDEVVRQFPKSAWVDDARFWSCYAMEKTGQSQETVFKCYQKFVDENPGSEWADEAKSNMIRVAQALAKTGKPEYQTIIESYEDAAEDDIKLTALYALQNIGDETALKTILDIYDKADELQAQEPDRLHARGDGDARGLRQAPRHRPARARRGGPPRRPLRRRLEGRAGGGQAPEGRSWPRRRPRTSAATRCSRWPRPRIPAWSSFFTQIALTEPDPEMARTAAFAIQEIEGKEATDALRRILKEAKDREIRQAALFALLEREDVASLPLLKEIVLDETDKEMARAALFQVAEIEGKESLAILQQVLATSKDAELRRTALMALGEHGGLEAKDALLKIALTSVDDEMAEMAVFALSEIKDDVGQDVLLDIMKNAKSERARRAVLMALDGRRGRGFGQGPPRDPEDGDGPRAQGTGPLRPRPDQERRGRRGPARDRQGQGRPAGPGRRHGPRRDRHAQGQGGPSRDPREEGRVAGRERKETGHAPAS